MERLQIKKYLANRRLWCCKFCSCNIIGRDSIRMRILDQGLWTVDCGLWTMESGLRSMDQGLWNKDHGTRVVTDNRGLETKDRECAESSEWSQIGLDLNYNYYLHDKVICYNALFDFLGRAGMAQCWWHLPPISVGQVWFCPGTICQLSFLLVLTSLRGFFSRFSGFPPSTKTNIFKFQSDQDKGPARISGKADVASSLLSFTMNFTYQIIWQLMPLFALFANFNLPANGVLHQFRPNISQLLMVK